MIYHEFSAIYRKVSRLLVLGSFPSVKSREEKFYYGNPSNRFWKVMARIFDEDVPNGVEDKTRLILDKGLALYDAVEVARIQGSMDKDLEVVKPADLGPILQESQIRKIFCNGSKAFDIMRGQGYDPVKLPSTSAANASYSLDDLVVEWQIILQYL